ncbi:CRISPR-associated endonuclease Cas6 [Thermaurantimonas aggregans]|uniref:CRISPR-associated endonuclease Cas6 n=1 Tax=Thermaurantimonas aggregans TaxID=2173829 RepID=UPI0023F1AEE6|nr:CRISPR-associated endonuclease Cas6 [Thermaurantimonas aggregans]MCX8149525.1 CRISPR-associated endonuclease Cas6 [Thermaurantimonas aggregans]
MKKVRTLLVVFQNQIAAHEIPAFRGAVIKKVGLEHIGFHNHRPEGGFYYEYPGIQYKSVRGNAAIFCIDDGTDEITHLFQQPSWKISISDRELHLKIHDLILRQITFNVWDYSFEYYINRWLALNEENYEKYNAIEGAGERIEFLEKILIGNILSMAKGIDWKIDKPLKVKFINLPEEVSVKYKGVGMKAFNVRFTTNVFMPDYLGLGKGVSHGFGSLRMLKKKKETEDKVISA